MEEKSNAGWIVGVIIAAALVIGGIVWFATSSNDDTTENTSTDSSQQESSNMEQEASQDIVALASETPTLSTLVTAVQAAGLVETLQGEGPYTVFAPTNDAFNALPAGTLDTLLKPESKDQLTAVLTYHVVAGDVMSNQLSDGQEIVTVQGGKLRVKIADGKVYIVDAKGGEAMVATADVDASNGVVHIIDSVLLPQ